MLAHSAVISFFKSARREKPRENNHIFPQPDPSVNLCAIYVNAPCSAAQLCFSLTRGSPCHLDISKPFLGGGGVIPIFVPPSSQPSS